MTHPTGGGAGRGGDAAVSAGPVRQLTVLYDADCGVCRAARRWLDGRPQLVPLRFAAAGSATARALFPGLDHDATLREVTVVADNGDVYAGDAAWLACLWALDSYRDLADRLARPGLRPLARRVVEVAAAVREANRRADQSEAYVAGEEAGADDRCGR